MMKCHVEMTKNRLILLELLVPWEGQLDEKNWLKIITYKVWIFTVEVVYGGFVERELRTTGIVERA